MRLPDNLTPEQDAALIACLRMFARHGRAIRLAREREQQKTESPGNLAGAGDSVETTGTISIPGVCADV